MKVQKSYHFYAAHRNKNAGEKCGRIHGHTYDIEVTFNFEEIHNGVTVLFSDIDALVEPIIKEHCHWLLLYNEDPLCEILTLANEPYKPMLFETSAENLAIWFYTRIKNETKLPISSISLAETKSSKVIYNGEQHNTTR